MKYSRIDTGTETTLHISGSLDALTAAELRGEVDALVAEQRSRITVDLSELDLIDSSGVAVLVALFKRTRAVGGAMRVIGMRDQPAAVFKLLRLDRVFGR
jgi:anti-sigma B factor antagonist